MADDLNSNLVYKGKYKLTILGIEKSWYFPGGTVLSVVTLKDVEVK